MVSALDFRSGGWWFEPCLCRRVVSLDKKLNFTLSLFTQVYKWVLAIITLGVNLAMDYHPIQGGVAIFLVASCYRNWSKGGTILTTKLLLRKVSNYYILKAKAPTAKPFADICSIQESSHILESQSYLTSHVITAEKTLKLKWHIVFNNKISINSNRTTICIVSRITFLKFALLLKLWRHKYSRHI